MSSVSVVLNALRLNIIQLKNDGKIAVLQSSDGNKGDDDMKDRKTTVYIDGMMCDHCKKRVTETFKNLGIDAEVDLKKKRAEFSHSDVTDEAIKSAIEAAGYTVKKIER